MNTCLVSSILSVSVSLSATKSLEILHMGPLICLDKHNRHSFFVFLIFLFYFSSSPLSQVVRGPGWRAAPAPDRRPSGQCATLARRTVTATTAAKRKVSARLAEGRPSSTHSPSSPAQCVRLHLTVGKFFLKEDTLLFERPSYAALLFLLFLLLTWH